MAKILIINSFRDKAYVDLVKERGYYNDLILVTDDSEISSSDLVVSLDKKYPINLCTNIKQAIEKLRLPWYIISENEIEEKTLELVVNND